MVNYLRRLERLKSLDDGVDVFLVTDKNDIFYYTGFKPLDWAALVVGSETILFLTQMDSEGREYAKVDVTFCEGIKDVVKCIEDKVVGFDEHDICVETFLKLKNYAKRVEKRSNIIKQPRLIKELEEIESIKSSIKITRNVLLSLDIFGKSEIEVGRDIKTGFIRKGSEPAFEPIIASGKNSYFIHHKPTERKIKRNDMVILDIGAKFRNYCSDITRIVYFGNDKKKKVLLEDVKEIQKNIIDNLDVGKKFEDIQNLYKNMMNKKGYKVMHNFGHSVGITVHEKFSELKANMVITVEPGIYIKGVGGCRIEDMILIKRNKIKILTEGISLF